jgi:uncharacterized protein (DUF983 family)
MADEPKLSPIRTGLACRCPRCGKGRLFQGFLNLRPSCEACGLDYSFADAGDGPAVFIILIADWSSSAARSWWSSSRAAVWLHAPLWLPLTRPRCPPRSPTSGLQYHHRAAEGRMDQVSRDRGEQARGLPGAGHGASRAVVPLGLGTWRQRARLAKLDRAGPPAQRCADRAPPNE